MYFQQRSHLAPSARSTVTLRPRRPARKRNLRNDEQIRAVRAGSVRAAAQPTPLADNEHLCLEAGADLLLLASLFQSFQHFVRALPSTAAIPVDARGPRPGYRQSIRPASGNSARCTLSGSPAGFRMYDQTSSVVNASSGASSRTSA